MKIVLISPSAKSLQDLSQVLEQGNPSRIVTCHEGGINKLRILAEKEHPDVIIVEGLCHNQRELAPIEFISVSNPQIIIIMICTQQTPDFLIHAMQVGVREILPSPPSKEALEAAVNRAELKLGLQKSSPHSARILGFLSSKGGGGATFLASNLGYQLAAEGKKTLLIDLNLQFGEAVMTIYDRQAISNISEVASNIPRLDASFLNASAVQVASNFSILAAPDDAAQSLLVKPEHLAAILNFASNLYDFIILDINKNLDDIAIKALDRSDRIYLIAQATLPFIHNAKRIMTNFRSLGYPQDKIELIVNRHSKNSEISLDDIRSSLGVAHIRSIPNGYKEVASAINQGMPLATLSKSSPVLKAINDLMKSLLPMDEEMPGGLLQRFLRH